MFLSLFLNLEQVTNTTSKINRISSLFAPRPSSLHNPASASMVLHSNPFPAGPGTSGLGSFSWTWTPFHVHMYTVEKKNRKRPDDIRLMRWWESSWERRTPAKKGIWRGRSRAPVCVDNLVVMTRSHAFAMCWSHSSSLLYTLQQICSHAHMLCAYFEQTENWLWWEILFFF